MLEKSTAYILSNLVVNKEKQILNKEDVVMTSVEFSRIKMEAEEARRALNTKRVLLFSELDDIQEKLGKYEAAVGEMLREAAQETDWRAELEWENQQVESPKVSWVFGIDLDEADRASDVIEVGEYLVYSPA